MIFDAITQLLQAKTRVQRGGSPSVTISLPRDHPDAQALLAFAKKLMLPTTTIRESGLITKTGIESGEAADEFLMELRKVIGEEMFSELLGSLSSQAALAAKKKMQAPLVSPVDIMGAVMGGEAADVLASRVSNEAKIQELTRGI